MQAVNEFPKHESSFSLSLLTSVWFVISLRVYTHAGMPMFVRFVPHAYCRYRVSWRTYSVDCCRLNTAVSRASFREWGARKYGGNPLCIIFVGRF